jgi:hypothetical protein
VPSPASMLSRRQELFPLPFSLSYSPSPLSPSLSPLSQAVARNPTPPCQARRQDARSSTTTRRPAPSPDCAAAASRASCPRRVDPAPKAAVAHRARCPKPHARDRSSTLMELQSFRFSSPLPPSIDGLEDPGDLSSPLPPPIKTEPWSSLSLPELAQVSHSLSLHCPPSNHHCRPPELAVVPRRSPFGHQRRARAPLELRQPPYRTFS